MELPESRAIAPALEVLDEVGSTNTELAARARVGALEDFTVLVTTNQTAGRGRLGRVWTAPPGAMLATSVFLARQPSGWMPLLAGLAMQRAVASLVPGTVALKWPNDVQVGGLKVAGLLAELVPGGVVIGAGLNLTMTAEQLPTSTSTSLTLQGAEPEDLADRALAAYLRELRHLARLHDTDAAALRTAIAAACSTLGRAVRVELPGGAELRGTAVRLDEDGRLVVTTSKGEHAVAAGDITHLRFPDIDVG
jgi:BirA family biotin operon repressor/biotin-[acetyl-CoA-carboxylase] ligase